MRKGHFRSIGLIVICTIIFLAAPGCTSTRNLLAYLKFWAPRTPVQDAEVQKAEMEEKIASFSSQVKPLKGNPDSHYLLALHYQQRGRHREAIEEFTKSVMIDPSYYKAFNAMGVSYDNLKEFDKAKESYQAALKLMPGEDYIYNNLGYSLVLQGDYESAQDILKKGVELNPSNEQLHNNLAVAYAGMDKCDLALQELNRTNTTAGALFTLAQILQQNGRPDRAEAFFAAASALDPSLERKAPEKERFIAKVADSVKRLNQAKTTPVKERPAVPKRVSQQKTGATTRGVALRQLKTNDGIDSGLEHDFMKNKVARVSYKGYQFDGQKKDQPITRLVGDYFPKRHSKGSEILNTVGIGGWF